MNRIVIKSRNKQLKISEILLDLSQNAFDPDEIVYFGIDEPNGIRLCGIQIKYVNEMDLWYRLVRMDISLPIVEYVSGPLVLP